MVHETINYKLLAIKKFCVAFFIMVQEILKLVQEILNNIGNFEVGIRNFGNLKFNKN